MNSRGYNSLSPKDRSQPEILLLVWLAYVPKALQLHGMNEDARSRANFLWLKDPGEEDAGRHAKHSNILWLLLITGKGSAMEKPRSCHGLEIGLMTEVQPAGTTPAPHPSLHGFAQFVMSDCGCLFSGKEDWMARTPLLWTIKIGTANHSPLWGGWYKFISWGCVGSTFWRASCWFEG